MKKIVMLLPLIILSFLFLINNSFSQPQTEWVARYNSPENYNDTIADMEIDKMGNVYILGYNSYNFFTLKYNNNGILEWVGKYKGPSIYQGRASDMVLDDSGNVYITGFTYTGNQSPYKKEIVIIKYSPNGDTLWTKRFINQDSIECKSNKILFSKNNSVIVTGQCTYNEYSGSITILNYSKFGSFKDSILYPHSQTFSASLDASDNLYILGAVAQSNVRIIKYDTLGNITKEISDTIVGYKIFVDDDFNIYTSGYSSTGITREDIGTNKYDSSGQKLWFSYYHHNSFMNHDTYRDFTIDEFGNSYVTGTSADSMELAWDIVTIKYNQNGDSLWVQRYDSIYNSSDCPASITTDKNGNVIVAGYTNFNLLANWYITICYDSSGNQKFVIFYNNGLPFYGHEAKYVKTDSAGNIYVSGVSQNSNGDYDIATIKYSILSNINTISSIVPKKTRLYQNYPNPFNPVTNIRFDIPLSSHVKLIIYDALGREVTSLVNEKLNAGSYETNWDGNGYPSGVYFYRLNSGDFMDVKKFVLIK